MTNQSERLEPAADAEFNVMEYVEILLRRRKLILAVTIVFGALGLIHALFFRPAVYSSSAVFLGKASPEVNVSLNNNAYVNQNTNDTLLGSTYQVVMTSQAFLIPVIKHVYEFKTNDGQTFKGDLLQYFQSASLPQAQKTLLSMVKFNYRLKDSILEISVSSANPQLSTQIATRYVEEANLYYRNTLNVAAQKNLEFVAKRVTEARKELDQSQNEMLRFLKANRGLNSLIPVTENKEGASRPLSSEAQLYEFGLGNARREIELKTDLLKELNKNYELLKIEAGKESPFLTVIKYPETPYQPDSRGRIKVVALWILFGIAVGSGLALFRPLLERPEVRRLREALREA